MGSNPTPSAFNMIRERLFSFTERVLENRPSIRRILLEQEESAMKYVAYGGRALSFALEVTSPLHAVLPENVRYYTAAVHGAVWTANKYLYWAGVPLLYESIMPGWSKRAVSRAGNTAVNLFRKADNFAGKIVSEIDDGFMGSGPLFLDVQGRTVYNRRKLE